MAMGGLFFSGTIDSQSVPKEGVNSLIQSSAALATAEPQVSAKSKVKKKYVFTEVVSANAKCSCCMLSDYVKHAKSWQSYCPRCHKSGRLIFEKTRDCPEGMVRCTSCDADFCAVHGREHVRKKSAPFLTPA
jgi:hypothetical protein